MTNLLTTVTDAETKVVDTVRSLQEPVVSYVRKGVELADRRLPDVSYPASLPKPRQVLDSQYQFLTDLLGAQRDLFVAVADAFAPLAGIEPEASKEKVAKAAKSAKATPTTKA